MIWVYEEYSWTILSSSLKEGKQILADFSAVKIWFCWGSCTLWQFTFTFTFMLLWARLWTKEREMAGWKEVTKERKFRFSLEEEAEDEVEVVAVFAEEEEDISPASSSTSALNPPSSS